MTAVVEAESLTKTGRIPLATVIGSRAWRGAPLHVRLPGRRSSGLGLTT